MGGFALEVSRPVPHRVTLTPSGLVSLAVHREGAVTAIRKESIMDKSKADGLGKCLVCFQALWMLVQCAARLVDGLPLTLLEINTVGHVLCGITLYLIWFNKPQDMSEPIVLNTTRCGINIDTQPFEGESDLVMPVAQDWSIKEFSGRFTIQRHLVLSLAGSAFGALHLAAWNSTFPSLIEGLLWRSCAIYVTACGIVIACSLVILHVVPRGWKIFSFITLMGTLTSTPILYVGARLYLLLEAFLSLRALPANAYQTPNWTISIPHL